MFELSEKIEMNRNILKCDYIRYSPSETKTLNTANSQISIMLPREDSDIGFLSSYLDLNFDVLHAATNNSYVDINDIKLVNLGPIALFSNYKLKTSSGKQLENIDHAQKVSLKYEKITSARGCDDLSIGFHLNRDTSRRELTIKQNNKRKNIMS